MATIRLGQGAVSAIGTNEADSIFGNALDNAILGGGGADFIEGGAGADIIHGDNPGAANFSDTASYAGSTAGVDVNLSRTVQSGGDAAGDQLFSIENLVGSAFNDRLAGNVGRNVLEGGRGDDTLFGDLDGLTDTLDGGLGVDTADYRDVSAGLTIALDQTTTFATQFGVFTRTVDGSTSTAGGAVEDILRNMENAIGTAFDDRITGNEKSNLLEGGAGADVINGLGGVDTASYQLLNVAVSSSGLGPTAYDGTNGVDVDLMRSVQHGTIAEGDKLFSIENLIGSYGHDILAGNGSDNRIEGGRGDDTIDGRGGNDILIGGDGFDVLDGGAGDDTFIYDNRDVNPTLVDSSWFYRGRRSFGDDTIKNFETGRDKIDLSAIDAIRSAEPVNDAFVFVDAFTGSAGQLIYDGNRLMADVDGDKIADLKINVSGLQKTDIIF